nr:BhlA/UviB family holin-like peptide [Heliobacterium chlorum]
MISEALQQGLWAALFVSLYLYQLQEGRRHQTEAKGREDKLTAFLSEMSKQFEALARQYERLSEDVQDIKTEIRCHSK